MLSKLTRCEKKSARNLPFYLRILRFMGMHVNTQGANELFFESVFTHLFDSRLDVFVTLLLMLVVEKNLDSLCSQDIQAHAT